MVVNRMMSPQTRLAYARKIKKAREEKRLVQGAVASKLGQPIWLYQKLERGEPIIWHANVYKRLEEILGISEEPISSSSASESKA